MWGEQFTFQHRHKKNIETSLESRVISDWSAGPPAQALLLGKGVKRSLFGTHNSIDLKKWWAEYGDISLYRPF